MVGKKVMVLVNLKPAKLAGVLSEGMLLCAEDADGNLALVTPEKNMPAGARDLERIVSFVGIQVKSGAPYRDGEGLLCAVEGLFKPIFTKYFPKMSRYIS